MLIKVVFIYLKFDLVGFQEITAVIEHIVKTVFASEVQERIEAREQEIASYAA